MKHKLYEVTWQGPKGLVSDYVIASSLSMASITYKLGAPAKNDPCSIKVQSWNDATIYIEVDDRQ